MRLLTHNLLVCNVKGCSVNNYPLKIKPTAVEKQETEFNPDFVRHMLPKLDWNALCIAAKDVCIFFSAYIRRKIELIISFS